MLGLLHSEPAAGFLSVAVPLGSITVCDTEVISHWYRITQAIS
jgi:hypothetical protein